MCIRDSVLIVYQVRTLVWYNSNNGFTYVLRITLRGLSWFQWETQHFCLEILRHGFESWETKFGIVVLDGNIKNLMIFFPILEAQLQFQAFCGNYDIISRRTQKKNQSSLFSYCHEEHPCQKLFCMTQLAKLSFNHSIGRTHSWRFQLFTKSLKNHGAKKNCRVIKLSVRYVEKWFLGHRCSSSLNNV